MTARPPRPDSESAWVAWLKAGDFDQARTRVPDDHFDGMIRVSRIGGERLNLVSESVTMLFEVWHSSPLAAADLAHDLSARVEAPDDGQLIGAGMKVYRVTTTGPVEFPDDSSPLVRYQFTASCIARRT